jgi:arsenate reductase (glutaredoxin)
MKSRQALKLLISEGINPEIVEYLKDTPDEARLKLLAEKMGVAPSGLIRKTERLYLEKYRSRNIKEKDWQK